MTGGIADCLPVDPAYFVPGRFQGKTLVITGFARGMGQAAAIRAAREGANVVGIDWLPDEARRNGGRRSKSDGGKIAFMVGRRRQYGRLRPRGRACRSRRFGGVDLAINNAGVMDGVYSGEPIDFARPSGRWSSRPSTRPRTTIGTASSPPMPAAYSSPCVPSCARWWRRDAAAPSSTSPRSPD